MDLVRHAINEIRSSWGQYPVFMNELREQMSLVAGNITDMETNDRLVALFSAKKDWTDWADLLRGDDYSAVRLYTSESGYRHIFSMINAAFRADDLTNDSKRLRSATFLVELLNIDLFNYRARNPYADNFSGTVYRGMCISREELDRFTQAAIGPVLERYLSIPLAMVSATGDRELAMHFALHEARYSAKKQPVLWEIHISNLNSELLRVYRRRYPASVVTSLCAVPIHQLSDYSTEMEVLLRGPHFQIIRVSVDDSAYPPVHKIEAVMHNTNRDHITAIASNTAQDKCERDLFRDLILIDRFELCAELAERHSQTRDADRYHTLASQKRSAMNSNV